jgi:hypothetical protein
MTIAPLFRARKPFTPSSTTSARRGIAYATPTRSRWIDSASSTKTRNVTIAPPWSSPASPMAAIARSANTQGLAPISSRPMPSRKALPGVTASIIAIHRGGGASSSGSPASCLITVT